MALIPYFELIKIPVIFYKTMGQELMEPPANRRLQSRLLRILLFVGYFNYNVQWGLQMVFLTLSMRASSVTDIAAVAPCAGFGFIGNIKQTTLHLKKLSIRAIFEDLENIYPYTLQLQKDYDLERYVKILKPSMKIFASLYLFNAVYFGFLPLSQSIFEVILHGEKFTYPVGFPTWYPFDLSSSWFVYILAFSLQICAGYLTAVAYLAADLLLVCSVTQLCMHFDYISKILESYKPTSSEENHKFLNGILRTHIKCLELTASVDKIFGFSLLLNFLASSGTICFVGFQVMTGSVGQIVRYSMLMVTSLAQVLIISIYGNKLIVASQAVGEAAFGHPWYECDLNYRKMVALMICRSQKFAAIHAPTFPPISLETFMKVISMSYQFFAVLQTTSGK